MSTGNNQGDTIVSKKRKRVVRGYKHPYSVEVKKFNFFDGQEAYTGSLNTSLSYTFTNIHQPVGGSSSSAGSWQLVRMVDPLSGVFSYEKIGIKYYLRYIKLKGYINVEAFLPVTLHYKLVLIKSDRTYNDIYDFMAVNYNNFQPFGNNDTLVAREEFCRHNFYKTYKDFDGMSDSKTTVTVVSSGTIAPPNEIARPQKHTTLGTNPSISYTVPDNIDFESPSNSQYQAVNYLPINASITVNENIKAGETFMYLMLMTDHGVGYLYPNKPESGDPQLYWRASRIASAAPVRFNLFGICYFTDQ